MSRYDDNRTRRVATLVCLIASWAVFISVADAEDPPKPRPAVDLDRLLDDLLRIDVAALRAKQDQLSKQVAETPAKAKALRDRAKGASGCSRLYWETMPQTTIRAPMFSRPSAASSVLPPTLSK